MTALSRPCDKRCDQWKVDMLPQTPHEVHCMLPTLVKPNAYCLPHSLIYLYNLRNIKWNEVVHSNMVLFFLNSKNNTIFQDLWFGTRCSSTPFPIGYRRPLSTYWDVFSVHQGLSPSSEALLLWMIMSWIHMQNWWVQWIKVLCVYVEYYYSYANGYFASMISSVINIAINPWWVLPRTSVSYAYGEHCYKHKVLLLSVSMVLSCLWWIQLVIHTINTINRSILCL